MSGSWVTDGSGTRWIEYTEKKKRKRARAIRFAELKVGDQLKRERIHRGWRGGIDDQSLPPVDLAKCTEFAIVTDRWFDPVAGQRDELAGQMVAIRMLNHAGDAVGSKYPHTLRGLASNGYHYAGDRIAECKARAAEMNAGRIVGIGHAQAIRRRPRMPGSRL